MQFVVILFDTDMRQCLEVCNGLFLEGRQPVESGAHAGKLKDGRCVIYRV